MKSDNKVKRQPNILGTSLDEWSSITANITLSGQITGWRHDGRFFVTDPQSFDVQSIDLLEYVKAKSHSLNAGGGIAMDSIEDLVKDRLLKVDSVKSVYCHKSNEKHDFFVETFNNESSTISNLSNIYWDIFDNLSDGTSFEFKPLPSEYFREDELPEGSTRIFRR
jgi:hypothetical protein